MKTVTINGTVYANVPHINVPLSTGSGNAVFYETSDATADASKILQGYTGYGVNGKITGTMTAANVSQDGTTHVLTIS